jgi:hypothetical protein
MPHIENLFLTPGGQLTYYKSANTKVVIPYMENIYLTHMFII